MKLIALTFLLLIAPLATAQQTPCTQEAPCLIALDLDVDSITVAGSSQYTVTAGDWFTFDVFNTDGPDHEISIPDLGMSFIAPGLDGTGPDSTYGPFLLDAPGAYDVLDITSGQMAELVVTSSDVSQSGPPEDNDAPFAAVGLLGVALLGAALVARRS